MDGFPKFWYQWNVEESQTTIFKPLIYLEILSYYKSTTFISYRSSSNTLLHNQCNNLSIALMQQKRPSAQFSCDLSCDWSGDTNNEMWEETQLSTACQKLVGDTWSRSATARQYFILITHTVTPDLNIRNYLKVNKALLHLYHCFKLFTLEIIGSKITRVILWVWI